MHQENKGDVGNVVVIGLTFFLLYTSYNTMQNFQTSFAKTLGFWSLSTVYMALTVTTLFSSAIVQKIGEKVSLFVGGISIILYMAANIYVIPWVLIVASVVIGIGAAIIWTAQGSLVAKSSTKETIGRNNGIFFGLFMLNFVLGSLMAQFIVNKLKNGEFILKLVLTGLAVVSVILFSFVKQKNASAFVSESVDQDYQKVQNDDHTPTKSNIDITETMRLLTEAKILCTLPIIVYSGISASFFYGVYPAYMTTEWIGYAMTCFGVAETVGSFVFGRLSDVIGRTPVFVISFLLACGGYLSAYISNIHRVYLFFVTVCCLGLSDSGFNTQVYSLLGALYPNQTQSAFAYFKLIQSISSAAAFFYNPFIHHLYISILINASFLVLGLIFWLILHIFVIRKNEYTKLDVN